MRRHWKASGRYESEVKSLETSFDAEAAATTRSASSNPKNPQQQDQTSALPRRTKTRNQLFSPSVGRSVSPDYPNDGRREADCLLMFGTIRVSLDTRSIGLNPVGVVTRFLRMSDPEIFIISLILCRSG